MKNQHHILKKKLLFFIFLIILLIFNSCSNNIPTISIYQQNKNNNIIHSNKYGLDLDISGKTNNIMNGESIMLRFHIINNMNTEPQEIKFISSQISKQVFSKIPENSFIENQINTQLNSLKGIVRTKNNLESLDMYLNYPLTVSDSNSVKSYSIMYYLFYLIDHTYSMIMYIPSKNDVGKTFLLNIQKNHLPLQITNVEESIGTKNIFLKFTIKKMRNGEFYYKKDLLTSINDIDSSDYNSFNLNLKLDNAKCEMGYFSNNMENVICQLPYTPQESQFQKQVQIELSYIFILNKRINFNFRSIN